MSATAPSATNFIFVFFTIFLIIYQFGQLNSFKPFTEKDFAKYRHRVVEMFQHAYDGYIHHAYPYDELRPLTCDGHDTWGSFSLTFIDALDTLAVMGNFSEFRRVVDLLLETADFDSDVNVSVFETNIRVVGGILSAHLLSKKAGMVLEPGWPCSGPLLNLAESVARRILPAFKTTTGMPYGTVNLRHGVPKGETPVTCTAGVGTFIVEFGALSRLTGDPIFEDVAMKALRALWDTRSSLSLVGNHINVNTGKWTAQDAGIGGGIDSYFEYLVKGGIMFDRPELIGMFKEFEESFERHNKKDDWYMWVNMYKGEISLPTFQSLEAFWPGTQSLLGDIEKAMRTVHNYHQVWKQFGFTPEIYNIPKFEAQKGREGYPLRPELIESVMYLYQATKDPYLLQIGVDILESIDQLTKTKCGFATVHDVTTHQLGNRMESFFLAETTKYLYLLFSPDHFIHNSGGHGDVIQTTNGECVIDAGGYFFNTEAHVIDSAALYCCSAQKKEDDKIIQDMHDNLDLLSLLNIVDPEIDLFQGTKLKDWKRLKKLQKAKQKRKSPGVEEKSGAKTSELHYGNGHGNESGSNVTEENNGVTSPPVKHDIHQASLPVKHEIHQDKGVPNLSMQEVIRQGGSEQIVTVSGLNHTEAIIKKLGLTNTTLARQEFLQILTELIAEKVKHLQNVPNFSTADYDREIKSLLDRINATMLVEAKTETKKNGGGLQHHGWMEFKHDQPDTIADVHIDKDSRTTNGTSKKTDLLSAFKKIIKPDGLTTKNTGFSMNGDKNVKNLKRLKRTRPSWELMLCRAQPFHMRFSLMGEMFTDD